MTTNKLKTDVTELSNEELVRGFDEIDKHLNDESSSIGKSDWRWWRVLKIEIERRKLRTEYSKIDDLIFIAER